MVRGVRVCLLCVLFLLRCLYRAGTYHEANLDNRTTPATTSQEENGMGDRGDGPSLVVCSLSACLLLLLLLLLYYCRSVSNSHMVSVWF